MHVRSFRLLELINNFLFYLTAVHQQNNHLIKQYIEKQGGYILHLDATCEGDSPKLVSSIDPLSGFVLYSAKLKSENKDDLGGFLEEIKKRLGVPLVVVSDMAEAIKSAVKDVFGDIAHYICPDYNGFRGAGLKPCSWPAPSSCG